MAVTGHAAGPGCTARRRALGECLRSYRRLIGPDDVGLPARGRRRTPGLRREEVASLAGVGLSWYTWLEQGRVTASDQVLESVGRVLGVDDAGRRHLRVLSAPPEPAPSPDVQALGPVLQAFAGPAVLLDHRLDAVAANPAWARVWGDPRDADPARRNVVWQVAAGRPAVPVEELDELVTALRRQFRMAANLHAGDPRLDRAAELLRADAPARAALWDCRGVGAFGRPSVLVDGRRLRGHLLEPVGGHGASVLLLAR